MDSGTQAVFPTLVCGDTTLRYLVLTKNSSGYAVLPHTDWSKLRLSCLPAGCIPLFIAADMWEFMGGNSASNNTRFLNKMQSLKLSTKLNLEGLRIEGTHNSKVLHCFTIQAIFMILFKDMDNETRRMSIAGSLWDLWTKYGNCNNLPPDIHYKPTPCSTSLLQPPNTSDTTDGTSPDIKAQDTKATDSEIRTPVIDELIQRIDSLTQGRLSHIHSLRSLLDSYKKVESNYDGCGLKLVLDQHLQLTQGLLSSAGKTDSSVRPYAAGNTDTNLGLSIADKTKTSLSLCLLTSTSKWLAMSFAKLHPQVKERANKFKQDNIQSLDNLPAPRDLCSSLFPRAMVVFFEEWLKVTHNDITSRGAVTSSVKKRRRTSQDCSDSNIYPFILLMLEFANNSLISGVAHVLFTRLILDQPESVSVS